MVYARPIIELRMLIEARPLLDLSTAEFRALLAEAGIDPALLETPTALVSLNAVATALDIAARRSGDPAFGLKLGVRLPLGSSGLLGQIMMTAPTVRAMLEAAVHYLGLHVRPVEARFVETDAGATVAWSYPASFTAPRLHYIGVGVGAILARIRIAAKPGWMPLAVDLEHAEPEGAGADYRRICGPGVSFGAAENAIALDRATLAAELPPVVPGVFESMRRLGDIELGAQGVRAGLDEAAEAAIRRRMLGGEPFDLDAIAMALDLQPRALQYGLEQAGTTYEKVLARTRMGEALHLLRDTDASMTEIAARLGFSEPSAFTRAATKWFGVPPRAMRRRLRELTAGK